MRKILTCAFCLLPFAFPTRATADIVHLTNGSVLSVESWQLNGDTATFVLRSGGTMDAPESLIVEVLPDEYLHAKPQALPESLTLPAVPKDGDVRAMVGAVATRYGVDIKLAQALVKVESDYEPRAVSPKGAKGLMQLMPSVASLYSVSDPFNPAQNLDAGMRHLKGLLDRFHNDVTIALAAYNAGVFAVAKYGGIPPYPETQDYVRRIMALAR